MTIQVDSHWNDADGSEFDSFYTWLYILCCSSFERWGDCPGTFMANNVQNSLVPPSGIFISAWWVLGGQKGLYINEGKKRMS